MTVEQLNITIERGDEIGEDTIAEIINCLNETNQLRTTEYVDSANEWHYIKNDGKIVAFAALKNSYISYDEVDGNEDDEEDYEGYEKQADNDIGYLYVAPELRNEGVGKKLFLSVLENNREKTLGFSRISFDTNLLEEKGFRKVKDINSFVEGRTIEYYVCD